MKETLIEQIEKIAMPFFNEMYVDLVELKVNRYRGDLAIQIFADRPMGGITIGECALLNRKITEALEREKIVPQDFAIEVSSPGLDRPLRSAKDFQRIVGRDVRFYLLEPVGERIEYDGMIKSVQEEHVVIERKGAEITLPLNKINKGIQII